MVSRSCFMESIIRSVSSVPCPYQTINLFRLLVYVSHLLNLMSLLLFIILINANRVNPESSRMIFVPQDLESCHCICSYNKRTTLEVNSVARLCRPQHTGERFIRHRAYVKRDMRESAVNLWASCTRKQTKEVNWCRFKRSIYLLVN
jgi:hypothetical protein